MTLGTSKERHLPIKEHHLATQGMQRSIDLKLGSHRIYHQLKKKDTQETKVLNTLRPSKSRNKIRTHMTIVNIREPNKNEKTVEEWSGNQEKVVKED